MRSRFGVGAALAAAALSWGSARASLPAAMPLGGPCELAAADRARTPVTDCLACHDGTATASLAFTSFHAGGSGAGAHPIDVDYWEATARDRRLAAASELPRAVVLVSGRIACTSCHDGLSTHRARIAGDPVALCAGCHARM